MNLLLFPRLCEEERSPGGFLSKEWLVLSVSSHPQFFDGFQTLLSLSFFKAYPPGSLCWGQDDSLCDFLYPKWK